MNKPDPKNQCIVPRHLAIIMDGNYRWARQNGLPRDEGHRYGAQNVRPIAENCADAGVQYLTFFAFSTENWNRPKAEIELLFSLVSDTIDRELQTLHERDAKVRFIGDRSAFPKKLQRHMRDCEEQTCENKSLFLNIAMNYGGRWDVVNAARLFLKDVVANGAEVAELTESSFNNYLASSIAPEPELCIRTGGEQRVSNFLLWDLSYTELYFTKTYWPDFSAVHLHEAFVEFTQRQRRFGARQRTLSEESH